MQLDCPVPTVQEFGVQIERFGLQAGDVTEYTQLMQIIGSEQQPPEQ